MSFTDQTPFIVTEQHTKLHWGGGFNCKLCGREFKVGDSIRWVFAGPQNFRNFFVCNNCDGPNDDLIQKAKESYRLAVDLANRWGIYGPEWEREILKAMP